MSAGDALAGWRANPFFILGVDPSASRTDVERAGQRLLGLLALGSSQAGRCETPFGPATRDADAVRAAVAALRDPQERVVHELLATLPPPDDGRGGGMSRAMAAAAVLIRLWPA